MNESSGNETIDTEKIDISQIGYKSEWALAKFFDAYFNNPEINEKFKLKYICGRQEDKLAALGQLVKGLRARFELISKSTWRAGNREKEANSLIEIIDRLLNNGLQYSKTKNKLTGEYGLEQNVYDESDAIIIQSANLAHLDYINDAISHEKSVLCEKPLIPVIENGRPTKKYIEQLEELVKNCPEERVLMDAEHYSYKKSSLAFYENLDEILRGENGEKIKIKKIVGEGIEIDDPSHWRTQDILNFEKSGSGLMGDTLCHFIAFISNLGGKAVPTKREYDMYKGEKEGKKIKYDADTYNHIVFDVNNRENKVKNNCINPRDYFIENCQAEFTVAKFIDKTNNLINKENSAKEESKFVRFTLTDDSIVEINFITGETKKIIPNQNGIINYKSKNASGNEYVNIMNRFYDSIITGKKPITDFRNSLETMKSIYEAYSLPDEKNKRVSVYSK